MKSQLHKLRSLYVSRYDFGDRLLSSRADGNSDDVNLDVKFSILFKQLFNELESLSASNRLLQSEIDELTRQLNEANRYLELVG